MQVTSLCTLYTKRATNRDARAEIRLHVFLISILDDAVSQLHAAAALPSGIGSSVRTGQAGWALELVCNLW